MSPRYNLSQTPGSLGPLSPTCSMMWVVPFHPWDSGSSSTKKERGQLGKMALRILWQCGSRIFSRVERTEEGARACGFTPCRRSGEAGGTGAFLGWKLEA